MGREKGAEAYPSPYSVSVQTCKKQLNIDKYSKFGALDLNCRFTITHPKTTESPSKIQHAMMISMCENNSRLTGRCANKSSCRIVCRPTREASGSGGTC